MTATNREGIYAATRAGGPVDHRRELRDPGPGGRRSREYAVVAAVGGREDVVGDTISLSILPQWKRDRLRTTVPTSASWRSPRSRDPSGSRRSPRSC